MNTGNLAKTVSTRVDFETFCPDYHELDRTGVISPHLEDGILHAGYALLALTTAFYDIWRARTDDFFIYPQHFAILDITKEGVNTGCGRLPLEDKYAGRSMGQFGRLAQLKMDSRSRQRFRHAQESV